MKINALYPEGCRGVSQRADGISRATEQSVPGARRGQVLELSSVHLSDSFGRDAERSQEVVFELITVGLDGDGPLHAEQPGIALFVADRELFMKSWNADRSVMLLK